MGWWHRRYRHRRGNFFLAELHLDGMWFRHYGVTCHIVRETMNVEGWILWTAHPSKWPCELIAKIMRFDFPGYLLWSNVKSYVYLDKPNTMEVSKDNITRKICSMNLTFSIKFWIYDAICVFYSILLENALEKISLYKKKSYQKYFLPIPTQIFVFDMKNTALIINSYGLVVFTFINNWHEKIVLNSKLIYTLFTRFPQKKSCL